MIPLLHGRTPNGGRKGKSITREVKKAIAYLDYVIGSQESNRIVTVSGQALLNRTPTTAREIKESYEAVMAAKKEARLKAMDAVGNERVYANKKRGLKIHVGM